MGFRIQGCQGCSRVWGGHLFTALQGFWLRAARAVCNRIRAWARGSRAQALYRLVFGDTGYCFWWVKDAGLFAVLVSLAQLLCF